MTYIEYEPGTKHAKYNADTSPEHQSFLDAGILLLPGDIVIDIDKVDKAAIKAMIQTFDIHTQTVWTDRGAHLYFTKPSPRYRRRDGICRLGFEVEQLTCQIRPNGVTVKRNGILRQIDNPDVRQVLPDIFRVNNAKTAYADLSGLEEGDHRNELLFKHKFKLIRDRERNWLEILQFINQWIFAEPMDEREMETVCRDDDIQGAGELSEEYQIAADIMDEYKTCLWCDKLWFLDGNYYVCDSNDKRIKAEIWSRAVGQKTRFTDEILKQIRDRSPIYDATAAYPIRFRNGILEHGDFIRTPYWTEFTPYHIDIDYNPDAQAVPVVDDYLDQLTEGEPEYRLLLTEALGYIMITDPEKIRNLGKFFFLRGDGGNGKGTLLQIMRHIYGPENCAALSISQLDEREFRVGLTGKLCNLGDDVEPEVITNRQMKNLKNIATADTTAIREMYGKQFETTITATMFFTTNSNLRTWEKGYAYKRRVLWLPMFIRITKPDPQFISKLTTPQALAYWIRLLVAGYMRLYGKDTGERNQEGEMYEKKDGFTFSPKVAGYGDRYHAENNPMEQFVTDLGPEGFEGHTMKEVRAMFDDWNPGDYKWSPKQFRTALWEQYRMGVGVRKNKETRTTVHVIMLQSETNQDLSP